MRVPQVSRGAVALAVAVGATWLVAAVLFWGLFAPGVVPAEGFHPSQVWCLDHMVRFDGPLTQRLGFPMTSRVAFVAWVPALIAMPFQALGPEAGYLAALILPLGLSTVAGAGLLRRLGVDAVSAAALGVALALSPFVLGALAAGQVEKAQIWVVVLPAVALSLSLRGPRVAGVALFGVTSAMAAFTAPTLFAHLPWVLVAVGVVELARADDRRRAVSAGVACVAVLAVVSVWAHGYYRPELGLLDPEVVEAFRPATPPGDLDVAREAILRPDELWSPPQAAGLAFGHVFYLGIALSVAALAGLRRDAGAVAAVALVLTGVAVGLGETLWWAGQPALADGVTVRLPAAWLAHWGHPIASSGTWYRAVVLSYVGLVVLAGLGVGRLGGRAPWLAVPLALVVVGEGLWATSSLYPVERMVTDRDLTDRIQADPAPGAVLFLPIRMDRRVSKPLMATAARLDRSTSLVDVMTPAEMPSLGRVDRAVRQAQDAQDVGVLRDLGVRYVVWVPTAQAPSSERDALERLLGPPLRTEPSVVWVVE